MDETKKDQGLKKSSPNPKSKQTQGVFRNRPHSSHCITVAVSSARPGSLDAAIPTAGVEYEGFDEAFVEGFDEAFVLSSFGAVVPFCMLFRGGPS